MNTRFESRSGIVTVHDDKPGQHATLFGPHGEKLPFRGDQSLFDDAKSRYIWAFDATPVIGAPLTFATADRAFAGLYESGGRFKIVPANTVVRGDGGKPLHLVPPSAKEVVTSVQATRSGRVDFDRPTQQGSAGDPLPAIARRL